MKKMVCNTLPSLTNTCATSIVYHLWTFRDIYEDRSDRNQLLLLENKVRADVNQLSLPESLKSFLLQFIKPAGRHFFLFLDKWLRKTQDTTSERWLTADMLSECLTLYPIGMINHRKTAEKVLRSGRLNNVAAFRLACINNLEVEIGRLWPHVMQYFLNKMLMDYQKFYGIYDSFDSMGRLSRFAPYRSAVKEGKEVLFWISQCISKDRGTDLNAVPRYTCLNSDLYLNMFNESTWSGDVTFFECIKNSSSLRLDYNHTNAFKNRVITEHVQFFFYHFSSLNTEEKEALFKTKSRLILTHFLQWPLSSIFLEDVLGLWESVVGEELQEWLIVKILEILHGKKYSMHLFLHWDAQSLNEPETILFSDVYCLDELKSIWISLWKICPPTLKERVMASFVFTRSYYSFLEKASFPADFSVSTLGEQLRVLFVTNGEAVLEFLEIKNLNASLGYVISKYLSVVNLDFQLVHVPRVYNDVQYSFMSMAEIGRRWPDLYYMGRPFGRYGSLRIVDGLHKPTKSETIFLNDTTREETLTDLFNFSNLDFIVPSSFLSYIEEFLLLSNNNNNSLFYE